MIHLTQGYFSVKLSIVESYRPDFVFLVSLLLAAARSSLTYSFGSTRAISLSVDRSDNFFFFRDGMENHRG
jgi:hypothetical protein